jgi:hypothetical protein
VFSVPSVAALTVLLVLLDLGSTHCPTNVLWPSDSDSAALGGILGQWSPAKIGTIWGAVRRSVRRSDRDRDDPYPDRGLWRVGAIQSIGPQSAK